LGIVLGKTNEDESDLLKCSLDQQLLQHIPVSNDEGNTEFYYSGLANMGLYEVQYASDPICGARSDLYCPRGTSDNSAPARLKLRETVNGVIL